MSHGESFDRLKVAVRERPLREDEKARVQLLLRAENDKLIAYYPDAKEGLLYNYDYFFPEEAGQLDVFQSIGLEMVLLALEGHSTSCSCFGFSGTGKTHTLFGNDHEAGLIQLATKELFQRVEALRESRQYSISVAYWEMSCDKMEDALEHYRPLLPQQGGRSTTGGGSGVVLTGTREATREALLGRINAAAEEALEPVHRAQASMNANNTNTAATSATTQNKQTGLLKGSPAFAQLSAAQQAAHGQFVPTAPAVQRGPEGVFISNLIRVPVHTWEALDEVLMHGNIHRIKLAEARNARWHGFVKIYIDYIDESAPDVVVSSTMTFAHLKGADRVGQKGARGAILEHGSNINKSMSLLTSAMIHALDYRRKHLPKARSEKEVRQVIEKSQSFFMESRLTQVVGQMIGGNECAFFIGCLCALDYHEATDTLEVLQNAQQFTASVKRREYRTDAGKTQAQLEVLERALPPPTLADGHPLSEIEERVVQLRRRLNVMRGLQDGEEAAEAEVELLMHSKARSPIAPIMSTLMNNNNGNNATATIDRPWKEHALKAKLHGDRSTVYIPNYKNEKNTYHGQWAAGRKEGYGVHTTDTCRYEGSWKNGMRHGEGILWLRKGSHNGSGSEKAAGTASPSTALGGVSLPSIGASTTTNQAVKTATRHSASSRLASHSTGASAILNACKPPEDEHKTKNEKQKKKKLLLTSGGGGDGPMEGDGWVRVYVGGWRNDKRDGIGRDYTSNMSGGGGGGGDVYEGGFSEGKRSGIGKLFLANGDRIEGQFFNGHVHGLAILYCKDGDWFEGSWFEGLREGPGIWHYVRKQQMLEGDWHRGIAKTGALLDCDDKASNDHSSYVPRVGLPAAGEGVLASERLQLARMRKHAGIVVPDVTGAALPMMSSSNQHQHYNSQFHSGGDDDNDDGSDHHHQQQHYAPSNGGPQHQQTISSSMNRKTTSTGVGGKGGGSKERVDW